MLTGWISVFNLVFGHERQFSNSKIRLSSLTCNPVYSHKRVGIIVLPAFLIFFVLSLIFFFVYSIFYKISFSLILFINLIIYLDINYSEYTKNALINGNENDLAKFTLIRFIILPVLSIIYIPLKLHEVDFFYFSNCILIPFVSYNILNKFLRLRYHLIWILKSYIKMFITSYTKILSSIIPKLNNALFRNYLGLILDPQIALISIKVIIILSASEILIDIVFWPKNYRKLMALNLRLKIFNKLIHKYFMINFLLYIILTIFIYTWYNNYIDENNFKKIDGLHILVLILISFLFSFESLISYVSIRNNLYVNSQLINSLFLLSLIFAFLFLNNFSLIFILFSLLLILVLRFKYAVFKNFN